MIMLEKPGRCAMSTGVEKHYSESDSLVDAIAASLRAAGIDPERVSTADLAPVDEFHIRGRAATLALADAMGVDAKTSVLDIGGGLGGAARTLAEVHGCSVTGIDLTPSFCAAAAELSRWTGLDDRTTFKVGAARALPFDDDSFDAAMTIHAVMNIADKAAVYREARRVLKAGGVFATYDVSPRRRWRGAVPGSVGSRSVYQPSGDAQRDARTTSGRGL